MKGEKVEKRREFPMRAQHSRIAKSLVINLVKDFSKNLKKIKM